jgi:hypothetical protein
MGKDFTDVVGFCQTDDLNQRKMTLKIHSNSCGRVFVVISDISKAEYIACFKLPQADWVRAIFGRSQV